MTRRRILPWSFTRNTKLDLSQQQLVLHMLGYRLRAGQSLRDIFKDLQQTNHKKIRYFAAESYQCLLTGGGVSALFSQRYGFDAVIIALLESGEASDHFLKGLLQAITYLQHKRNVQEKTKHALRYPALVLLTFCSTVLFFWHMMASQIDCLMQDHSSASSFVVFIAFLSRWGWVMVTLLIIFWLCIIHLASVQMKRIFWWLVGRCSHFLIAVCLKGKLSYFFYTVSVGLERRLQPEMTLDLGMKSLRSHFLQKEVQRLKMSIKAGKPFFQTLGDLPGMSPEIKGLLNTADQSGESADIAREMSLMFWDDHKHALSLLHGYLGPALLIMMGLLFVWFVKSLILPFYTQALSVSSIL